jgi:hypothetical protein
MQINSAEQAGIVTFSLVLLTNLAAVFGVSGGTWPSGVAVVVGLISAGVAGLLAYIHVAGISVPTTNAASATGTLPPPKTP